MWQNILARALGMLIAALALGIRPLDFTWPLFMVVLAVLVVVPAGFAIHPELKKARPRGGTIAGLFYLGSCTFASGQLAGWLSLPWLAWTLLAFYFQLGKCPTRLTLVSACAPLATLQLAIGASWAAADRFGWDAFGFELTIVRLTAAHFHFAGFTLVVLAGILVNVLPASRRGIISAVYLGVLPTALGITLTRLGAPGYWETGLALAFCIACLGFGGLQFGYAVRARCVLLGISGACHVAAMILATLYALRWYVPVPWLHLPFLWAVHGSLQAIGFAGFGLLGWWRGLRSGPPVNYSNSRETATLVLRHSTGTPKLSGGRK